MEKRNCATYLLDWDGTIFWGGRPRKGAGNFVSRLLQTGNRVCFLTNNSSLDTAGYEKILQRNGLWGENCSVITSGRVTAWYVSKKLGIDTVYILGTRPLIREFNNFGIMNSETHAKAVILGFDKSLNYRKIQKAHELISCHLPFIATHDDKLCPMPNTSLVDCGSMIEMFRTSTGISPIIVGKPHRIMCGFLKESFLTPGNKVYMIGDRLDTDGKMAEKLGIDFFFIDNTLPFETGQPFASILTETAAAGETER